MQTFIITFAFMATAMIFLAISAILTRGRRCLRGTCGGDEVVGPDGEDLTCDTCPKRERNECPNQ